MKRTQIYLDDGQDRALAERARATGRTKSAVIRRAIDAYLAPDDDGVGRLRAALEESAGAASDLPAGTRYVEALRRGDRARADELERRRRR